MMELGFVTVTTGVRTVSRDWSGVTLEVLPHPATARWLRPGRDKLVSLTSDGEQLKRAVWQTWRPVGAQRSDEWCLSHRGELTFPELERASLN